MTFKKGNSIVRHTATPGTNLRQINVVSTPSSANNSIDLTDEEETVSRPHSSGMQNNVPALVAMANSGQQTKGQNGVKTNLPKTISYIVKATHDAAKLNHSYRPQQYKGEYEMLIICF